MTNKIVTFSMCALLLLTGITYGAQNEVYGDFSVKPAPYEYWSMGAPFGVCGSPRCSCDETLLSQECPNNFFNSDTDQGEFCYDIISTSPCYSREYGRVDTTPMLNVTSNGLVEIKSGDLSISKTGYGIILKATNGDHCFRVTVDDSGQLQTSAIVPCP